MRLPEQILPDRVPDKIRVYISGADSGRRTVPVFHPREP